MSKATKRSTRPCIKTITVHWPHMDPNSVVVYEVKNGRVPAKGRQKSRRLDDLIDRNRATHVVVNQPGRTSDTYRIVLDMCADTSFNELSDSLQNAGLDDWSSELITGSEPAPH